MLIREAPRLFSVQPSDKHLPLPEELYAAPTDRPTALDRQISVLKVPALPISLIRRALTPFHQKRRRRPQTLQNFSTRALALPAAAWKATMQDPTPLAFSLRRTKFQTLVLELS